MSAPLPFYEPFDTASGSTWPNWEVPAPGAEASIGGSASVSGGRGVATLSQGWLNPIPQFSARIALDSADPFELTFTFDMSELAASLSPTGSTSDPAMWLNISLFDTSGAPVDGTDFYQIYYAPYGDGVQAALKKWTYPSNTGGQPYDDPWYGGGYISPAIDPSAPMFIRIQETGSDRYFKVWQGPEPSGWMLSETTGVSGGARYVDFSLNSNQDGTPSVYFDDVAVNYTPGSNAYSTSVSLSGSGSLTVSGIVVDIPPVTVNVDLTGSGGLSVDASADPSVPAISTSVDLAGSGTLTVDATAAIPEAHSATINFSGDGGLTADGVPGAAPATGLLTTAELNALADTQTARMAYLSLHTGDGGTTGANEEVDAFYARQPLTWHPAVNGVATADPVTFLVDAGTYIYSGFWDSLTGGTFLGGNPLAAAQTLISVGSIEVTAILNVTSTNG